jgi:hypothetical protein
LVPLEEEGLKVNEFQAYDQGQFEQSDHIDIFNNNLLDKEKSQVILEEDEEGK